MKAEYLSLRVSLARAIALKAIQDKFKTKDRIIIDRRKKLRISGGFGGEHIVREIYKNGEIRCWHVPNSTTTLGWQHISTEAVIAILAELESK